MQPHIQNHEIPPEQFGPLVEVAGANADFDIVHQYVNDYGYCLLRGILDRTAVLAARSEVFQRMADVDEIQSPAEDGVATGRSSRRDQYPDVNAFWKDVSNGTAVRQVTHGDQLRKIITSILLEPARAHDLIYLRPTPPGKSTRMHYDYPFFAGQSLRIHTVWIPFGDIRIEHGPLVIVEGSNGFSDLIDPIRSHDYSADRSNAAVQKGAYDAINQTDPMTLIQQRNTRLLSTEFRAGDLVVFNGFTMHGSLDNISPNGQVRLSCDVRFQPAADPADDERYFGTDPLGSNGGGYGDMRAAKPLTE